MPQIFLKSREESLGAEEICGNGYLVSNGRTRKVVRFMCDSLSKSNSHLIRFANPNRFLLAPESR